MNTHPSNGSFGSPSLPGTRKPVVIQGLWIGPRLSKIEQLCIKSFLDHGHPFHLYCYEPIEGIPAGTDVIDANEIVPDEVCQEFRKERALAAFSDLFRWKLLHDRGNFWVDMDIICLRPFEFSQDIVFGFQQDGLVTPAVLRFPPGHPVTKELIDRTMNPNRFRREDTLRRKIRKAIRWAKGNSRARIFWGEAGGPDGFQAILDQFELRSLGLPFTAFYPVYHVHFTSLFDATFAADDGFFAGTYALHIWNEVGRRFFPDWSKDADYHPDSIIEKLKRKHLGT